MSDELKSEQTPEVPETIPPVESTEPSESKSGFFEVFMNIFVSPVDAFIGIKEKPRILLPMLVMFIMQSINGILMVKKIRELVPGLAEKLSSRGLPPNFTYEQFEQLLMKRITIGIFVNPIITLVFFAFILGLIIFIYFKFTDREATFKQTFSLVLHSYFINSFHSILLGILLMVTKYKGINNIQDFQSKALGFQLFLNPENMETVFQKIIYVFLLMNNPFSIWALVVMAIGVKVIYGTTYKKAAVPVIIIWFITVVLMGSLVLLQWIKNPGR